MNKSPYKPTASEIQISIPTIFSVLTWIILGIALFGIAQTSEMLTEFVKGKQLPLVSILFYFIFSWSTYWVTELSIHVYEGRPKNRKPNSVNVFISTYFPLFAVSVLWITSLSAASFWLHVITLTEILGLTYATYYFLKRNSNLDAVILTRYKWYYGIALFFCAAWVFQYMYISNESFQRFYSIGIIDAVIILIIIFRFILFLTISFNLVISFLWEKWRNRQSSGISATSLEPWVIGSFLFVVIFMNIMFKDGKSRHIIESGGALSDRITVADYFDSWIDKRTNDSTITNIYLIAAQGGGSRGGYTTYKALEYLADSIPDFEQNLFAVSSVSGSTVGTAIYRQSRYKLNATSDNLQSVKEGARKYFATDFVTKSFLNYAFAEPFSEFDSSLVDRNMVLKNQMDKAYNESFEDLLSNRAVRPYDVEYPIYSPGDTLEDSFVFIANSFNIQDAQRAIVSSVKFESDRGFDDILASSKNHLKLSDAVNLSEMFPFLSASALLKYPDKDGYRNYYDGGVYDNYGISSINDLYQELSIRKSIVECEKKHRFVCIYLANSVERNSDKISNSSTALVEALTSATFYAGPNREMALLRETMTKYGDVLISIDPGFEGIQLNRWLSPNSLDSIEVYVPHQLSEHVFPLLDSLKTLAKEDIVLNFDTTEIHLTPGTIQTIAQIFSCGDEDKMDLLWEYADFNIEDTELSKMKRQAVGQVLATMDSRSKNIDMVKNRDLPKNFNHFREVKRDIKVKDLGNNVLLSTKKSLLQNELH